MNYVYLWNWISPCSTLRMFMWCMWLPLVLKVLKRDNILGAILNNDREGLSDPLVGKSLLWRVSTIWESPLVIAKVDSKVFTIWEFLLGFLWLLHLSYYNFETWIDNLWNTWFFIRLTLLSPNPSQQSSQFWSWKCPHCSLPYSSACQDGEEICFSPYL